MGATGDSSGAVRCWGGEGGVGAGVTDEMAVLETRPAGGRVFSTPAGGSEGWWMDCTERAKHGGLVVRPHTAGGRGGVQVGRH